VCGVGNAIAAKIRSIQRRALASRVRFAYRAPMRHRPVTQNGLQGAVGWLAAGVGLIAVVVITALTSSANNAFGAGLLFVGLLVGGFASIVIHELGHAIAAWLVGWRVWIISALPVVVRLGHKPHFSTKLAHDVGGYVLGSPPTAKLDRPWRSAIFSAGGPIASLLTGPLFIYWLATMPPQNWEDPTKAGLLGVALAFGTYGTLSAAWTAWPARGWGGRPNDAMMIIMALREPKSSDEARGAGWAGALFEFGVEPSAWPEWMRDVVARAGHSPWAQSSAPVLAFMAALDANREADARAAAERSAQEPGKVLRAYVAACLDNDVKAAELALQDAKPTGWNAIDWLRALTEARIFDLRGDSAAAQRARDDLASEIADSGAPQPFWDRLLVDSAQK